MQLFLKDLGLLQKNATDLNLTANGVIIHDNLDLTGTSANGVVDILSTNALAKAAAANVTLDASVGANPIGEVYIGDYSATNGQRYSSSSTLSNSTFAFAVSDTMTLKFGSQTVTITSTGTAITSTETLVNNLMSAWNTKYADAVTTVWTIASAPASIPSAGSIKITATSKDKGNANHGVDAKVSFSTESATQSRFDFRNGLTKATADDKTVGPDIVITLTAKTAGPTLSEIGLPGDNASLAVLGVSLTATNSLQELSSTLRAIAGTATATSANLYPTESRGLVTYPEDTVSGATCATCAAATDVLKFNTTNWTWSS